MKPPRIIAGLVVLAVLGLGLYWFSRDPYYRFRHQDETYYARFAQACDAVLAQHPVNTRRFIEVPATEAGLPQIIRDLQPYKIKVSTNYVWIGAKGGQFGIDWTLQDEAKTNAWALSTSIESDTQTLYVVKRPDAIR